MAADNSVSIFAYMDTLELSLCLRCNRVCQGRLIELLFVVVSRLGNGVFWYALIAALPLYYGPGAVPVSLRMILIGALGLGIYKALKSKLIRQRPYIRHAVIRQATASLDLYSFPSGHTLHAVSFSAVAVSHFAELAWLLVPFTLLVAMSRVVLGLHYPSDVLAGGALGLALAAVACVW